MANDEHIDSLKKVKNSLYGHMKNKQRNGFVDCCKEFKFIRRSNTISFNNKMNRLGLTYLVLDERYNMTSVFLDDIINPIRYGSNVSIGIEGYTGTGKSELAETIVLISKQANEKYKKRIAELALCWFNKEIFNELKKIEKGDIMWVDESPKTVGTGSRVEKWSIDNALHVIRKMENTFIFVDPKKIKVDICDLYLESAGMNLKTKENRFMIMDDEKYYFGHIYTKLHKDKEFREWYELEKDKFIKETLDKGGRIEAGKDEKKIELQEINEEIKEGILYLNKVIPNAKKHKQRNILIWKLHKEDKRTYSFEAIAKSLSLGAQTVEDIYYKYNKEVKVL